jgi:hypothetical protein
VGRGRRRSVHPASVNSEAIGGVRGAPIRTATGGGVKHRCSLSRASPAKLLVVHGHEGRNASACHSAKCSAAHPNLDRIRWPNNFALTEGGLQVTGEPRFSSPTGWCGWSTRSRRPLNVGATQPAARGPLGPHHPRRSRPPPTPVRDVRGACRRVEGRPRRTHRRLARAGGRPQRPAPEPSALPRSEFPCRIRRGCAAP